MSGLEKCCAFTQGSRAATISQPLSKLNVLGLSARKWTKLFMMILHGCGWVVCITLHDDMFSCLDFSFTAQAADGKVREESLSILPNGGVAGGHASETGAERVGKAYRREP